MIKSFKCKDTRDLFEGTTSLKPSWTFKADAERKLRLMDSAVTLESLRNVPSNRLKALGGDRSGEWSILINQRYRICFIWNEADGGPSNLEISSFY